MDTNQKFWNRTAKLYTPIQEKSNRKLYREVTERCRPYINREKSVLELACGTGQFTFSLCECAKSWEATDFSPNMVEEASRRNRTKARFSVENATHLTFPAESFDVVLIANALHIMPEPEKALAEIRRVLRPGGILLAPTFIYEGKVNRFRMKLVQAAGFRTFYKWTLAELGEVLTAAGFSVLEAGKIPGNPLPEGFAAARKD